MTMNRVLSSFAVLSLVGLVVGCGGAQEVEVTGEAKSASAVSGPISIEFFDVLDEEQPSLAKLTLEALGPFEQTVEAEGEEIRVFALADADEDGACTDGEAWAEARAAVKDDGTAEPITLELATEPCPAADAGEK